MGTRYRMKRQKEWVAQHEQQAEPEKEKKAEQAQAQAKSRWVLMLARIKRLFRRYLDPKLPLIECNYRPMRRWYK